MGKFKTKFVLVLFWYRIWEQGGYVCVTQFAQNWCYFCYCCCCYYLDILSKNYLNHFIPLIFWCFQEVWNKTSYMKWFNIHSRQIIDWSYLKFNKSTIETTLFWHLYCEPRTNLAQISKWMYVCSYYVCLSECRLVCWLVSQSIGWLVSWLIVQLVIQSLSWLVSSLVGWLVDQLFSWLFGWLVAWSVGRSISGLFSWLVSW